MEFRPFPKLARLNRDIIVTEKIDGTNASVYIGEDGEFLVGSRTRWITPSDDNFGFAAWANHNKAELMQLGPGHHFGEWWGAGIQRRYGLTEKRFSLFNVSRWNQDNVPLCCSVVPTLYSGPFDQREIQKSMERLALHGSAAVPGFDKPEGVVVFHTGAGVALKWTFDGDQHKGAKN